MGRNDDVGNGSAVISEATVTSLVDTLSTTHRIIN